MTKITTNKRRPQGLYGLDLIDWVYDNRTEKDYNSGCILWTGLMGTMHAPMIGYGRNNCNINRLFWEFINNTKIPEGLQAGHICEAYSPDHHRCINYKHIKLMTPSENMQVKVDSHIKRGSTAYMGEGNSGGFGMPYKLPHSKKVEWITKYKTKKVDWIDGNGKAWKCINYLARESSTRGGGNSKMSITFNSEDSGQSIDIHMKARTVSTHRYIHFILEKIDYLNTSSEIVVRHKCANGLCIKPKHLTIGDKSDNALDMRSYSSKTKLSEKIVKEIMEYWLLQLKNDLIKNQAQFSREIVEKLKKDPYNVEVSTHTIDNFIWRGHTSVGTWPDITKPYLIEATEWYKNTQPPFTAAVLRSYHD